MTYDLLRYRNMQVDSETDSMQLLYYYGKYKKDREKAAQAAQNPKVTRAHSPQPR